LHLSFDAGPVLRVAIAHGIAGCLYRLRFGSAGTRRSPSIVSKGLVARFVCWGQPWKGHPAAHSQKRNWPNHHLNSAQMTTRHFVSWGIATLFAEGGHCLTKSNSIERTTRPERTKKSKRVSIRELLKPHLGALSLGLLGVIGEGVANLLEPWPLKLVLDDVLRGRESHAGVMRWIHEMVGTDKLAMLKFACAAVLVIAVLDAICTYAEKYLTTSVGQWIAYDLRGTIYAHVQKLSLAFHDQKRIGDLISRVTNDIDAIQSFITTGLLSVLVNIITLVGMIVVMSYLNWKFTLIALSVAPVLFFVVFTYTRRIKKAAREVRKKEGEITSVVEEVLSSIRVVKAFAREEYEVRRLEEESLEGVEIALRARSLKAKLTPIVGLIVAVGTCLVLWFGARLVMNGGLSAGSLVVFILYLAKMYKPMQELSKMTDTYSKAAVGYERIREVLETDKEIKDVRGAIRAPRFKGEIEFDHVSFAYDPETPILKDVSFTIEPGQVAALVGPTGAGKTSIISLIPRFYDPPASMAAVGRVVPGRSRFRFIFAGACRHEDNLECCAILRNDPASGHSTAGECEWTGTETSFGREVGALRCDWR
jgi:membrane protein implicated in regulation of membrane protease activity